MKGLSVKPKTQRNRAVLLTKFATLLRREIHINIKIDADVPFCALQYVIYFKDIERSMLVRAHASTIRAV
jgi:hypothetical protein